MIARKSVYRPARVAGPGVSEIRALAVAAQDRAAAGFHRVAFCVMLWGLFLGLVFAR